MGQLAPWIPRECKFRLGATVSRRPRAELKGLRNTVAAILEKAGHHGLGHSDIALRSGACTEDVSKALSALRKRGVAEMIGREKCGAGRGSPGIWRAVK